jgi:hypothetical protein
MSHKTGHPSTPVNFLGPSAGRFREASLYIDEVLYINNNQFHTSVDLIYANELEIKDTSECSTSALYLDILLKFDTNGKSTTQLMTNGIILISPSSTFLSYGAIFQFHLHMVFIPCI